MAQPVLTMAGQDRSDAGQEQEPPMVLLAEVAALFGKHPEALRSMIRRGQLAARRDNRRGWLVAAPQPAEIEAGPVSDRPLANLEDTIAELRDELAGLREALGWSEAGREGAIAQARAEGETRAARAEADAAAQRELVTELRKLLEDARRPWWRRLLGVVVIATVLLGEASNATAHLPSGEYMCELRRATWHEGDQGQTLPLEPADQQFALKIQESHIRRRPMFCEDSSRMGLWVMCKAPYELAIESGVIRAPTMFGDGHSFIAPGGTALAILGGVEEDGRRVFTATENVLEGSRVGLYIYRGFCRSPEPRAPGGQ